MASGFFAILDDITALMDDVAVAAKVATRKTAGILGDDLAVNAEKATGFLSDRELPILWAITKGSLLNKLIIVPVALALNAFFPVAITYILGLGGCYLAYEGGEKIIEFFLHKDKKEAVHEEVQADSAEAAADMEKTKVKSAITTDFILSVEIVIIALGTVLEESLTVQIATVSVVAILATIGVYGIVALIVRSDDTGYKLIRKSHDKGILSQIGHGLVRALPIVIRILGVVGTLALLLVSGGIFVHNVPFLHDVLPGVPDMLVEFGIGLVVGLVIAGVMHIIKSLRAS